MRAFSLLLRLFGREAALALPLVGIRLHLDVGPDRVGVILEIGGVLDDILLAFFLDALHLDVSLLQPGAGTGFFGRRSSTTLPPVRRGRGCSIGCSVPHFGQTAGTLVRS